MADLIIIAYRSEEKAEAARNKILELQKIYSSRLATPWWLSVGTMAISN